MKTKQKEQRHFKFNRDYYYNEGGYQVAKYTKVKTVSGYGVVGMYANGNTFFYEDKDEQLLDEMLLCWITCMDLDEAKKIIFK